MERPVKKMGTRKYFPLGKEKGRMKKQQKRRFEKMKAKKKWWKKDERKNEKIQRVTNTTQVFFCNEITKWSKWKIHKKRNKKSRMNKRRKEKQPRNRKKKEDHPKKRSKKKIFFQTQKK